MKFFFKYLDAFAVLLALAVAVFACSIAMADDMGGGGLNGIVEGTQASSAVSATGAVSADLTFPLGFKLVFGVDPDQGSPSLTFETGSGIMSPADNTIYFVTNGTARWGFNDSYLFGLAGNTYALNDVPASSTVPTMSPRGDNGDDNDTGLGGGADGEVSVISNANEKLTINGSGISTPCTSVTLGVGVTTFAVNSGCMVVSGDALGNAVLTITAGDQGSLLRIKFSDALVTLVNDDTHAPGTLDLSAPWVSTAGDTITLMSDGTSWYEQARSVN